MPEPDQPAGRSEPLAHYGEQMQPSLRGGLRAGVHLTGGQLVVGVAGYAYLSIVGHVFDAPASAAEVTALTSLYLLISIIGPGVFAALEQETSRSVSTAVATGQPLRPVVVRAGVLAASACAGLIVVVLAAWPLGLARVLGGQVGLLAALLLATAGSAAVYWARGVLGGQQRFGRYALTFYVEGAVRLLPCLVLLVAIVREPGAYGLVFAAGSVLAALAVLPSLRFPAGDAPAPPVVGMGRAQAVLAAATLLMQVVANLAPVVVAYRMPENLLAASVFGLTFVVARIPLFLFAPAQAVLLPKLTTAEAIGRRDVLRWHLRRVLLAVAAFGVVSLVVGMLVGPWAVHVLFNAAVQPAAWWLGLLGAATALFMAVLVMQAGLVALSRQRSVTMGWVSGSAVFLAVLFAPVDPVAAALAAQLAGPVVVLAYTGMALHRALRGTAPTPARQPSPAGYGPSDR